MIQCHLHVAIDTYTEALAKSGEQRELRLICQYELGNLGPLMSNFAVMTSIFLYRVVLFAPSSME